MLVTGRGTRGLRLLRMPAPRTLAISIATAALLLAPASTVAANAGAHSATGQHVILPAGQVRAMILAAQPAHQAQPTSSALPPFRSMNPEALRVAKIKAAAGNSAPSSSGTPTVPSAPSAVGLFNGLNKPGLSAQDGGAGATPPDTTGAIGPTHYLEMVNQRVAVYDRSSLALLSSQDLGSFVGAPSGTATSDPQIQWDPQANRWLYAEIGFATGKNLLVFGWSKTADPSDLANGWCHYGISTFSSLQDYPKLGHDANFVTVGSNVYDDSKPGFPFVTANIWAIPKPAVTDSTCSSPVTATYFADATHLLKNADGTLAFTPVPANTSDSATNDYIVAAHDPTLAPQAKVMVWHMEARPNPVLVADGDIAVGTFAIPAAVPQPGTSFLLDSLDGRLTQAVAHFDSGVGAEAVWTQQTVAGPGGRSMVRWYEFAPSLAPAIVQQGQVTSATDFIFNAAISPSAAGRDAAIFYNRGSSTQLALIGAQSRTRSTAPGQMDPGEVVLGTSSAADQVNAFQGNCSPTCRWGDYSGATPDPANAGVVWGSNQLSGPVFFGFAQWTTQNFAVSTGAVTALPDFSLSASPASQAVVAGSGTSYTVSITAIGGFTGSVSLGASGLPSGAAASFSPNPVNTSGTSTMSLTTSTATPPGTYTVTISGQSGSLTHTAAVSLVVQAPSPPDFSVSASPSSQTVVQGSAASYTVTITPSGGFTGTVALNVTGLPSGAGASFNPNTISASGTSTMTVTTSATTPTGSYNLTITGVSGTLTHNTNVALVVQVPPPPPDFSLSVSPSSQGVTHGNSITYAVTITPSGGFTGAVTLSASGLPSGATAAFSPNPAGSSSTLTVTTNTTTPTGNYTLAIAGVSGALSHSTSVTMVVLQDLCNTPTLSTGAATSPYPSGAGAITLTATGQCNGGTEFLFYYRDLSNVWHVIGGSYSSSNTAVWNADYKPGSYMLEVDIRPTGSSAGYVTYVDLPFSLSGCGVPTLTPDLPSPQPATTTVHWTATVSCSGTPQYEFYVHLPSGGWTLPQPWGPSNTFTWNSPAASGAYIVEVVVRNAGATEDPYDNYTDVNYSLSAVAPHCTTPTLSTGAATSPYPSGAGAITLTATGQCNGGTEFEFFYRDLSNVWHVIGGGYGSSNTAVWNADYKPGNYMLEVDIRPTGSSAGYVTYVDLPFSLSGCGVPTLSPDLPSPQPAGTTVHWTATVSCSGTPQYEFYVHLPSGGWTLPQPWGPSNTFTWNSPFASGAYIVEVVVRNAGATEDPYDNYTDVNYSLSAVAPHCTTPTLSTGAATSPYPSGAGAITLTATGQCNGGTEFLFFYRDLSNVWHVIGGGYGSSNTAVWNADYKPGNYMLEVDIRPTGSSAGYVTYVDLPFSLSGCGVPTLSPDLPSPQPAGTTVHWTATVSCSGTPQYEFYVHLPSGGWTLPQPWGPSNTFTWNAPAAGGAYIVAVVVRNAGATEDPYDNYADVNFTLG